MTGRRDVWFENGFLGSVPVSIEGWLLLSFEVAVLGGLGGLSIWLAQHPKLSGLAAPCAVLGMVLFLAGFVLGWRHSEWRGWKERRARETLKQVLSGDQSQ